MKIEKIDINLLKMAKYNPRKDLQPEDIEYQKIKRSLEEFGYVDPIIINKDMTVIGGNQRLKVLRELGYKKVDCVILDLDKTKEKALNIALNKIQGEWDLPKLKDLLLELDTGEFDIEITGFDYEELEELMTQFYVPEENEKDDEVPDIPEKPISKLGDLYKLDEHRLLCGDATKIEDIKRLINGENIDMVFTDPPYGVSYEARTGIRSKKIRPEMSMIIGDNLSNEELFDFLIDSFSNIISVCKDKTPIYICNNWHCSHIYYSVFKKLNLNLDAWIVWNKDWLSVGHGDYRSNHEFIFYSKRKSSFYAPKGTEHDVWTIRKLSLKRNYIQHKNRYY